MQKQWSATKEIYMSRRFGAFLPCSAKYVMELITSVSLKVAFTHQPCSGGGACVIPRP